ncbi:elongation factor P maturation arginine rhamnosyltransferase EarP [Ramlibacter sp. H39-3-26]|uniref:elongation factor P maturation arginine rhamnosyltransferase EarP n=1 Tax=Curvibacter soli TaxID=3031331 RepID=UPI0023DACDB1|nr:elongation factor P maturation arginine rhamnosyltransferase EarP [Ramlibacter sp. H39-3-26]MDF1486200.1 elongation factor P maturation arginine rhamnosyltransferase EarP [Ramlibacter sp. H39-3-26]
MRWDIFCRVIDNYGDIGVCWRLAANLAERGHAVRLWSDDARALAWMAPQGCPGVQVLPWPAQAPADGVGDVVVEAFGCEIAPEFVAAIAGSTSAGGQKPLWINLEYLSAEGYVERSHGLPSPMLAGPGAGLTKHFFYPGFTPATGGLLREPGLPARQAAFDRAAWRAAHGVANGALAVSLFCYEPAALGALLARWADGPQPVRLLATPGRATAAVRAALQNENSLQRRQDGRSALSISYLDTLPQPGYDELLWASDLNFVRGEDSLVRALWAGQPFVWHIYPQPEDDAHHAKLDAFLDWFQAPGSLRHFHHLWNGLRAGPLPALDAATLAAWHAAAQAARARLLTQDDLVAQLLRFVAEKQ